MFILPIPNSLIRTGLLLKSLSTVISVSNSKSDWPSAYVVKYNVVKAHVPPLLWLDSKSGR